ncbi:MAG: hypothetical protein ACXWC4_19905 [Telluria sp.]
MDANQRSEANNQTNNGANEKWNPGSEGKTRNPDAPLDHTYPQGQQAAPRVTGAARDEGGMQTGVGPGVYDGSYQRSDGKGENLQGGSMQTQQTGGSGPQQGITDSHQQAMEQRSPAYGQLEQPVGDRPNETGTSLPGNQQSGNTQATEKMNPQDPRQPELQGGSFGGHHGNQQSSTQGGGAVGTEGTGMAMPRNAGGSMGQQSAGNFGTQGGGQPGPQADVSNVQRGGSMNQQSGNLQGTQGGGQAGQQHTVPDRRSDSGGTHDSTDRIGSQTGNYQREMGVHESDYSAGGHPRSPGNSGPYPESRSTHLTGAENLADLHRNDRGVHDSNNSSGGLPRSPGGANKLAADEKMDDDTGLSNPGRP